MFFPKKSYPQCERKIAYADLTGTGKGILPQNVFNAFVNDGKLMSAKSTYEIISHTDSVEAFVMDAIGNMFFLTNNGLYIWRDQTVKVLDGNFRVPAFMTHESTGTLVITSQKTATYAYVGNAFVKVFDRGLMDMVCYRDRCFGVRLNKLYFSEQGSATNWTGSIDLPFEARTLAVSKDGIYIVGNDVYLLEFNDNETDSKLTLIYRNISRAKDKSLKGVGKGFMFLSDNGVEYFNGSACKLVARLPKSPYRSSLNWAATLQGKYYVCFYPDEYYLNSRVAVVDVTTQTLETVYDIAASSLSSDGTSIFFTKGNYSGSFSGNDITVNWQSRPYNFGNEYAKKSLDTLLINSASDATVTLRTEAETRILHVKGSKKLQKIPLHGAFNNVTLTIESNKAEIYSVGIVANVLKEEVN